VNRRAFLRAAGLGSFFLPSLARAASAPRRPRFVVYTTSHGTVYDRWKMRPAGTDETVDFDCDLAGMGMSPILAPLAAYTRRLLVVDGLSDIGALVAPVAPHDAGHAGTLTGRIGASPPHSAMQEP
jgi:hypothetical protein